MIGARDIGMKPQVGAHAIRELGLLARDALRAGRRGRIAAVFERSLYAVFDDDWICIGPAGMGSGPCHVLCDDLEPDRFFVGQDIAVTDVDLHAGDTTLTDLDAAPVWSPRKTPEWTRQTLRAGLLEVDRDWQVSQAEDGLAAAGCPNLPLARSHVLAAAAPGLAALVRIIEDGLRGRKAVVQDVTALAGLIGLGPGLTPSGDDLLGGALVALASLGQVDARDILWALCREHLHRTNDISAAHLRNAASGYAASALHDAISSTMCGHIDRITPALAAVSEIGHSSGRDAFAGALIVLRAVERQMAACNARRTAA